MRNLGVRFMLDGRTGRGVIVLATGGLRLVLSLARLHGRALRKSAAASENWITGLQAG